MDEKLTRTFLRLARVLELARGKDLVVPGTLLPALEVMRSKGAMFRFFAELHALLESGANPHIVPFDIFLASRDEVYARTTMVVQCLTVAQLEAIHRAYRYLQREARASDAGADWPRAKRVVSFDLSAVESLYLRVREFHGLNDASKVTLEPEDGFLQFT